MLWHCQSGVTKSIRLAKTEWWRDGIVICLNTSANDLHMAQQIPLLLTISCSSKSRLVWPSWYRLTTVVPDKIQESRKTSVCVRNHLPSVSWCCWLGGRNGIQPVKTEWWDAGVVICLGDVQICIWPSWCHCHSLSLASVNPDWFYLSGTGSPGQSRTKGR